MLDPTEQRDSIKLVRVGEALVLMIEVYPTAFMLALDEEQAVGLAQGILESIVEKKQSPESAKFDSLLRKMAKKGEEPS